MTNHSRRLLRFAPLYKRNPQHFSLKSQPYSQHRCNYMLKTRINKGFKAQHLAQHRRNPTRNRHNTGRTTDNALAELKHRDPDMLTVYVKSTQTICHWRWREFSPEIFSSCP